MSAPFKNKGFHPNLKICGKMVEYPNNELKESIDKVLSPEGEEVLIQTVARFAEVVREELDALRNLTIVCNSGRTRKYAMPSKFRLRLGKFLRPHEFVEIINQLGNGLIDQLNDNDVRDGLKGSQIRTGVRTVIAYLMDPTKSIVVASPTQGGKTGTIITILLLLPMLSKYMLDRDCVMYNFLTSQHSFKVQADNELESACQMYKWLEGDFKPYYKNLRKSPNGPVLERLGKHFPDNPRYKKLHGSNDEKETTMRRVISDINKFSSQLEQHSPNTSIAGILDEAHFASNVRGGISKVYQAVHNSGIKNFCFIFVSATPYELKEAVDAGDVTLIKQDMTGENGAIYQGFNFCCGWEFEGKFKPLPIYNFAEYGRLNGFSLNVMGKVGIYDEEEKYEKDAVYEEYESHEAYRSHVRADIIKLFHHFLVDDNHHDGRGAVLRFVNKDSKAQELAADMKDEGLDDSIDILIVNCEITKSKKLVRTSPGVYRATTKMSIKQIIEELDRRNGNSDRKYLIIVTGSARMGAQFPLNCKYFVDTTGGKNSTASAILQGLPGRASGFGKDSIVLVNNEIDEEIKTRIVPGKGITANCHYRVDTTDEYGYKPRKRHNVIHGSGMVEDLSKFHPRLKAACKAVQADTEVIMGNSKSVTGTYTQAFLDIGTYFDDETMSLVEDFLAKPHRTDEIAPSEQAVVNHKPQLLRVNEIGMATEKSQTGNMQYITMDRDIDMIREKLKIGKGQGYNEATKGYDRISEMVKFPKKRIKNMVKAGYRDEMSDAAAGYKPELVVWDDSETGSKVSDLGRMLFRIFLRAYDANNRALTYDDDKQWKVRLKGLDKNGDRRLGRVSKVNRWEVIKISFLLKEKCVVTEDLSLVTWTKDNSAHHSDNHLGCISS